MAEFQQSFVEAIKSPEQPTPAGICTRPGADVRQRFNIYRNNHVVGLADALAQSFPVVKQLVGDEFFHNAAIDYVRRHLPSSPVLLLYGESFADYLASLPGVAQHPYLPDVARLEWTRLFALNAADAAPIPVQVLSSIDPEKITTVQLVLHPSLRLLASQWPMLSIWQDCQDATPEDPVDMTEQESIVVVRPDADVVTWRLNNDEYVFVASLQDRVPLGVAAEAALEVNPNFDLSMQLGRLFQRGMVVGVDNQAPAP